MVEGAALEMLCPARDPGFESLTLRQAGANSVLFAPAFSVFLQAVYSFMRVQYLFLEMELLPWKAGGEAL